MEFVFAVYEINAAKGKNSVPRQNTKWPWMTMTLSIWLVEVLTPVEFDRDMSTSSRGFLQNPISDSFWGSSSRSNMSTPPAKNFLNFHEKLQIKQNYEIYENKKNLIRKFRESREKRVEFGAG